MRYFVKILGFDTPGNLYRFDTGNQAIVDEYWTPHGWKRDDDAELVGYLVAGREILTRFRLRKRKKCSLPHLASWKNLNLK
jgi:hypothetical protein